MQFTISCNQSDIKLVTFSEIDFGRQEKALPEEYVIKVSYEEFANRFQSIYAECVTELIRDDEITGEFHPPYTGAVRYPLFKEFWSLTEHQRMEMINTYFAFDILRLYICEDASDAGRSSVEKLCL